MPPIDDDLGLRLLSEVQALRYEVDKIDSRASARALKVRLIALYKESLREGVGTVVGKIVEEFCTLARASIMKRHGTRAWDAPPTVEVRAVRPPVTSGVGFVDPAKMASPFKAPASDEPKPLTDEELAEVEGDAKEALATRDPSGTDPTDTLRLVAEVRRLRADEWLERAAAEYARAMGWQFDGPREELLAVLRNHRDGKA